MLAIPSLPLVVPYKSRLRHQFAANITVAKIQTSFLVCFLRHVFAPPLPCLSSRQSEFVTFASLSIPSLPSVVPYKSRLQQQNNIRRKGLTYADQIKFVLAVQICF